MIFGIGLTRDSDSFVERLRYLQDDISIDDNQFEVGSRSITARIYVSDTQCQLTLFSARAPFALFRALEDQDSYSQAASSCRATRIAYNQRVLKAHVPGAVRWMRSFAPLAASNTRRAVSPRSTVQFAKKSGNTFRRADKLGQRWRPWRLDISTHTASASPE
jgi:hypothetical protein